MASADQNASDIAGIQKMLGDLARMVKANQSSQVPQNTTTNTTTTVQNPYTLPTSIVYPVFIAEVAKTPTVDGSDHVWDLSASIPTSATIAIVTYYFNTNNNFVPNPSLKMGDTAANRHISTMYTGGTTGEGGMAMIPVSGQAVYYNFDTTVISATLYLQGYWRTP